MNWVFYRQQLNTWIDSEREQGSLWLLWFVVLPLAPLVAYMMLGLLRILPGVEEIPRSLYIVFGMTAWMLFSEATQSPGHSINRYRSNFVRQEITLFELLTAWLPSRLTVLMMQLCFCLIASWILKPYGLIGLVTYLGVLLAGLVLFTSIGAIVGTLGLIAPGVAKLIETSNRFLLFVSAAIFPLPDNESLLLLKQANPYYVFIDASRQALFDLPVPWELLGYWLLGGLITLAVLFARMPAVTADIREFLQ